MKCLFACLLVFASPSYADVFKWIDGAGRVHYGDSPQQAEKVERVDISSSESVSNERNTVGQGASSEKVTMYSTSWCGYCKKAREYFLRNNIHFVEYDIERNARARAIYERLGAKGVPVILVGGKRMNGFSVSGFEKIYR